MTVHSSSTLLEYLLFIEGVQIPVTSVAIRISVGQPASADFDIAPLNSGRYFSRGMKVDFFRKSSSDEEWVLKFTGVLSNVIYTKSSGVRRLTISALSVDAELYHVINGAYNDATSASAAAATNIDAINNLRSKQSSYRTVMGGHLLTGHQWRNIHATASDNTVGGNSKGDLTVDSVSTALSALKFPVPSDSRTNAQYRVALALVSNIWKTIAVDSGGNIIQGVMNLIDDVFRNGNAYLQYQHMRYGMDNLFSGLSIDAEGEVEKTLTQVLKLDLVSIAKSVDGTESGYLAVGLLGRIYELINSSPYEISTLRIVVEILRSIFYTYVSDPARLENSIIFMPVLAPCAPPRCNVFFKEQLDNISYNPDNWNEITRSITLWPPVFTTDAVKANTQGTLIKDFRFLNRMYLSPSYDPILSKVLVLVDKQTTKDISKFPILTAEELSTGVNTNVMRLQGNEYLVATDNEAGWIMSDYLHWNAKFEHRRVTAQGALIEDLAVGFPACILDGEYTLMGILQSATYTVEASGKVNTTLEISHARYHDEFKAPYPAWLYVQDAMDPNIGEAVYRPLIGTLAMTNPCTDANPTVDEDQQKVGLAQWAHAKLTENAYENSVNKAEFRKQYRARTTYTLSDYLAKFGCTVASQDSKGRPLVLDGKIFEDLVVDTDPLGGPIDPPYTSGHRRIALAYLKEYIGKAGINDE